MTRTLPWLTKESRSTDDAQERAHKRQRMLKVLEDGVDSDTSSHQGAGAQKNRRSPSTSPPPAPPQEEFMVEGLGRDDDYIMVEDEFNDMAKTFTQHLHHAEYVRLKTLAKSRNASAIQDVSRPVDTSTNMPEHVKKQLAAKSKSKQQHKKLNELSGKAEQESDEDQDDDPWVGTSLHGLMTSPRKNQRLLSNIADVKSNKQAAEGRRQLAPADTSSEGPGESILGPPRPNSLDLEGSTENEDEDDDLDAPPRTSRILPSSSNSTSMPQQRGTGSSSKPGATFSKDPRPPDKRATTRQPLSSMSPEPLEAGPPSSPPISTSSALSLNDVPQPSALQGYSAQRSKKKLGYSRPDEKGPGGIENDARRRSALLREIPTFL